MNQQEIINLRKCIDRCLEDDFSSYIQRNYSTQDILKKKNESENDDVVGSNTNSNNNTSKTSPVVMGLQSSPKPNLTSEDNLPSEFYFERHYSGPIVVGISRKHPLFQDSQSLNSNVRAVHFSVDKKNHKKKPSNLNKKLVHLCNFRMPEFYLPFILLFTFYSSIYLLFIYLISISLFTFLFFPRLSAFLFPSRMLQSLLKFFFFLNHKVEKGKLICEIQLENDQRYPVHAPFRSFLMDINSQLQKTPGLVKSDPEDSGYLFILWEARDKPSKPQKQKQNKADPSGAKNNQNKSYKAKKIKFEED